MNDKQPIISFCIPSYNRSDMTLLLVNSILCYKGDDIEVIVVDNCSTDNTFSELKKIDDTRLTITVNKHNLGGPGNMIESLRYGKGVYSFVAFSREEIVTKEIGPLITFLKETDYTVIYCCQDTENKENVSFAKGFESLQKIAYKSNHPTGLIFRNDVLRGVLNHIDSKDALSIYLYFPHEFLIAESLVNGRLCMYGRVIRKRVKSEYIRKSISANVLKEDDVWFFPKGREKQLIKYLEHLQRLPIEQSLKVKIFVDRCRLLLLDSTYAYKSMRENEDTCLHYSTTVKTVSFLEMMRISGQIRHDVYELATKYGFTLTWIDRIKISLSKIYVTAYYFYMELKKLRGNH